MTNKKILDITYDVKWIGSLDPDLVTFDVVMETKFGTTYNSYFINADKIAIVETVKEKFFPEYLEKLKTLCNPADIKYIILDHTEPDHSGAIAQLMKYCPDAVIVGSGNAIRYLGDMVGFTFKNQVVKDGDTIDLGNKTLKFISAPNLHWPDSIYTYLVEDKLLFTCDSFGAHYCNELMFDDLVGNWDDAFTYYFNVILKPYSKFMLKAIERIRPLDISAICPGHGPILRTDWKRFVDMSEQYALAHVALPGKHRIFIPYVSAYHNTGLLAEKIAEGVRSAGDIDVDVCDIEMMPIGDIDEKLTHATGLIIGSPTINQNILPQIYTVFAMINPIRDRGKLSGCFGSYGWSGEAVKIIESNLMNLKLKPCGESLFIKFTPHEDEFKKALDYGRIFGQKLINSKLEE
jgi:flavorubredoxin